METSFGIFPREFDCRSSMNNDSDCRLANNGSNVLIVEDEYSVAKREYGRSIDDSNKKPRISSTDSDKCERGRALALKTKLKKKLYFEALQLQVAQLVREREYLTGIVKENLKEDVAQKVLTEIPDIPKIVTTSAHEATAILAKNDYRLVAAIQVARHAFCITNPLASDNPIVYASDGFLNLTGYTASQVIGKNCRFLQGSGTDKNQVDVLRKAIHLGVDTSVCLLNYRADGSPFYNQMFVAALKNDDGCIVNYVGVYAEVANQCVEKTVSASRICT